MSDSTRFLLMLAAQVCLLILYAIARRSGGGRTADGCWIVAALGMLLLAILPIPEGGSVWLWLTTSVASIALAGMAFGKVHGR